LLAKTRLPIVNAVRDRLLRRRHCIAATIGASIGRG